MSAQAVRSRIRSSTLWIYRILTWTVLAAGFIFAATVLALRYWILPDIARYREDIAQVVSRAVQQQVTIGSISANWDGLRPQLGLLHVVVHDAAGRPALDLPRVDATLSWRSAALLQVNFHALDIHRPVLIVRRDAQGAITVAGIPMNMAPADGGGFSRWVLGQRDIEIHDARLVWTDELRGAPELSLDQLQLRIVNEGLRHRIALRAVPPTALATPLDVRADLRGEDFQTLAEALTGQLYVQVDRVDIPAWRPWFDFPVHFPHGTGALRAWLTFDRSAVQGLIADAQLNGVRTRLAADLPELDLAQLGGRFSWRRLAEGFEVTSRKLTFTTGDGLVLPPVDLALKLAGATAGGYARGDLQANALVLAPLVQLADRLPFDAAFRKALVAHAPSGSVSDLVLHWAGAGTAQPTYTVRGRFSDLAVRGADAVSGFAGFGGSVEATEKGGTLTLAAQKAGVDLPQTFRDRLRFDVLNGQLNWTRSGDQTELRFANFSFSNPDLAGTLTGTFRVLPDAPGVADLTGHLTRGAAQRVTDYLPLKVAPGARPWLDHAFLDGESNDVRFRLKGDLKHFPFVDEREGLFEVTAKVSGGGLHYGDGWPRITGIDGDLLFRGKRMDIQVRQAAIGNVRLAKVRAQIADLASPQRRLLVTGEAEGETADFLAYIAQSPVTRMIDGFTEGLQAQGRGRLGLKLEMPLQALPNTRVSGNYQFIANRLLADAAFPPLEQVNGRLEFTESSVRVPSATAVFLGGPMNVSAGSQRDAAVSIQFQGRINADAARRAAGAPAWIRQMRGVTDWRGSLTLRKKRADLVVESSLQGLAVNLPAPFIKSAAEIVPLRFERRFTGAQQDRIALGIGPILSTVLYRRDDPQGNPVVERGVLRFGEGAAGEPERAGIAVSGALKSLDVDGWLALFGEDAGSGGAALSAVDLRVAELELFDRRFGAVAVKANLQGGALQSTVQGRDIDGVVSWQGQGKGRISARLKRLTVPAKDPPATPAASPAVDARTSDWPALDVVVDEFRYIDHPLGRLELQATPQQRDWRIERLRLSSADGVLNVDGLWQSWLTQPRTQVNVQLDVSDIGKFLARVGYPDGVRRGTAKLEGTLAWNGSPQRIDYPTLSGNFVLDAGKGQFLKLEPGIGKLLGILSLQSLPRRISLDFRDIFSEGLAFDEIVGAIKVNRGVASTDNLRITGPAARINMAGQVDLARETQQLRVKVIPQISDSVSVAGALIGGPVAGLAAFIAQKLLKDPLDQIAGYEYDVTGNWADPQVTKIERAPVARQEGTP